MKTMSRHRACKLCRDRKVRCDGNEPICEKCRRLGEKCVYGPTYKPTKADLAQTIEALRDRIDSAESIFGRQNTRAPPDNNNQLIPASDSGMSVTSMDCSAFVSPTDQFFPSSRTGQPMGHSPKMDNDFLSSFPMMIGNEMANFRPESVAIPEDQDNMMIRRPSNGDSCSVKIPSLREIRALNSNGSSSPSSPGSKKSDQQFRDNSRIINELQTFSSTIFQTQTEVAGILSAVAEYLAWIRNVPGMPRAPDCTAILERLEARIREVQDMVGKNHWVAWTQMLEKLDGTGAQLGAFGAELQKRTAVMAQEFHTSYEIERPLQEQHIGFASA